MDNPGILVMPDPFKNASMLPTSAYCTAQHSITSNRVKVCCGLMKELNLKPEELCGFGNGRVGTFLERWGGSCVSMTLLASGVHPLLVTLVEQMAMVLEPFSIMHAWSRRSLRYCYDMCRLLVEYLHRILTTWTIQVFCFNPVTSRLLYFSSSGRAFQQLNTGLLESPDFCYANFLVLPHPGVKSQTSISGKPEGGHTFSTHVKEINVKFAYNLTMLVHHNRSWRVLLGQFRLNNCTGK